MGFFDDVKSWTKTQASNLSEGVKKFKNKKFMDATVAGCAMVAFADGIVSPEEKTKMAGFIQRNEALKVFDMTEVVAAFEKFVQGFEFDAQIGKAEALRTISKLKKNSEEGRLLVRVCCAIGMADGNFDDDEKRVVREICHELGLNPDEFNLPGGNPTPPTPPGTGQIKDKDAEMPDWMKR